MVKRFLIFLIKGYQKFISPLLGDNCRFYPTCSAYAIEALRVHGALKGSLLATWRILRCNPFGRPGLDPVPPKGRGNKDGGCAAFRTDTEIRAACARRVPLHIKKTPGRRAE